MRNDLLDMDRKHGATVALFWRHRIKSESGRKATIPRLNRLGQERRSRSLRTLLGLLATVSKPNCC
jgi:hypothetical protein